MAKLDRKKQKILGGNSNSNGQFGSISANAPLVSNDPDIIQSLSAWESGWNAATISGSKLPALEDIQGVDYVATYQLSYLLERGIPEYSSDTAYYVNALAIEPNTAKLYKSLADDNEGNSLHDAGFWRLVCDFDTVQPLCNYTATTDPTINDDEGLGYTTGSIWYNSIGTGEAFLCVDSTVGAAKWIKTTLTVDELGSAAFVNTGTDPSEVPLNSDLGTAAYENIPVIRSIPQNSQSDDYTLTIDDAGKHIFHPNADETNRTFTIPANASVAFPVGTAVTFVNQNGTGGVITIAITSDTMRLAGSGATGSRQLARNGMAVALKIAETEWIISGTGLS